MLSCGGVEDGGGEGGGTWSSEFLRIGPVRFICVACNKRRKAELRNLPGNKLLAAGGNPKR